MDDPMCHHPDNGSGDAEQKQFSLSLSIRQSCLCVDTKLLTQAYYKMSYYLADSQFSFSHANVHFIS